MVEIRKQQVFDFFKATEIVKETYDNYIKIYENNNRHKTHVLKEVKIINLNINNKYFEVNPENPTYIKSSKPSERVIIEDNNDYMNIVIIEMKPLNGKGIQKKLERTFSWLYLLFNLLKNKENKKMKVFYVLCKYNYSFTENIVCKNFIDVFHNLRVKYIKKIYYSNNNEKIELNWNEIIDVPNGIGSCDGGN